MSEAAPGKDRPRSGRHLARVFALLGLYQWLADPQLRFADVTAKLEGLIADEAGEELDGAHLTSDDFARADRELFEALLSGVLLHAEETEAAFSKHVDRDLKRVSLVERAILYLGAYELAHAPQTPYRVVLNEAIELAKTFGSGYRFTNAVLEKVARDVRAEEFALDHASPSA